MMIMMMDMVTQRLMAMVARTVTCSCHVCLSASAY